MTALEQFATKTTVPSWARTAEWDQVPAMFRRRAFFSAAIEDARALSESRKAIANLLQTTSKDGKIYRRDTAISELQRLMQERGLDTGKPDDLRNPASEKRLELIIDTNRAQAQGYVRFKRSSTGGALFAFPAQELVRVERRYEPRAWPSRWQAEGGQFYGPANNRMIALKTDSIWTAINRFGNPYPPFDFNSGMGVRDISRREAIALGIIAPDYVPESDPVGDFNANLEASVAGVDAGLRDALTRLMGDQAQIKDGVLSMQQSVPGTAPAAPAETRQLKSIVSGNIKSPDKDRIVRETRQIIEADEPYWDYGLRMLPEDIDDVEVGDRLEPSFRWEDGENSGESLEGVSTIGIHGVGKIDAAIDNFMRGGYYGRKVALVRGVNLGSGEDLGENVLDNARVLKIWEVGTSRP